MMAGVRSSQSHAIVNDSANVSARDVTARALGVASSTDCCADQSPHAVHATKMPANGMRVRASDPVGSAERGELADSTVVTLQR